MTVYNRGKTYIYRGDRFTDPELKGSICYGLLNKKTNKCIRGKNGNMLVLFPGAGAHVILARQLRIYNK